MERFKAFLKEEDGVTALEYGLLAAVIAGVLVIAAGPAIGGFFEELFTALGNAVSNAVGEAGSAGEP